MRIPRFRIRTLMLVVVGAAAVLLGVSSVQSTHIGVSAIATDIDLGSLLGAGLMLILVFVLMRKSSKQPGSAPKELQ